MPTQHAAKRWCFTLNNYTPAEYQAILDSADNFDYLIVAREHGDSGTPHLQGYFILNTKLRLRNVKQLSNQAFQRAHLEVSRGTPQEASDYCKKGDVDPENPDQRLPADYEEFGELPVSQQGKRNDFERFRDWILSLEQRPTDAEVFIEFPSLYGRYRQNLSNIMDLIAPAPRLVHGPVDLRPWQQRIHNIIDDEPVNNRQVIFVVDPEGNSGKSFLTRYWFTLFPERIQLLSIGRRDDLAHAIDITKSIFAFDIPRGGMEFMQYNVLEQLKNGVIFSPKYCSQTKILRETRVHVIVFCNEEPDRSKMTADRFIIYHIRQLRGNTIADLE